MFKETNETAMTISFEYRDNNGAIYTATNTIPVSYDLGETPLGRIGEQFNVFLKQAGYYRPNDYIFMESITEEEYDALAAALEEYRSRNEENSTRQKYLFRRQQQ